MTVTTLRGEPVAANIRDSIRERIDILADRGVTPTLATVLVSDDPADVRFLELKHETCAALGIGTRDRRVSPDTSTSELSETVSDLSADPDVDAVFVQSPFPQGIDVGRIRHSVDPAKDVDCFHPENLGRLVLGDPRFVPATTAAVVDILAHYDVSVAGEDVVIVGRSPVVGRPLANRLLWDDDGGNATVTVCHSQTPDLGAHTRQADVLVTACGVPELVDGPMLGDGVVVVDVSANRRVENREVTVVGDVDAESASRKASAMTPVPGGVGPVTLVTLVENVLSATERRR